MRTITVTSLIFLTLFLFNNHCDAQAYKVETFSGSIGAEALFPETKLSSTNKTGAGFTLKGEYVFASHASATISSGYYFMQGKDELNIKNAAISAIPVKAGVRYYFGTFYGAVEAGGIIFIGNNSRADFLYSLGLGDKFKLGRNVFDIGLRHEGWANAGNSTGMIALRVACEFALNQKQDSRMPGL